MTTLSDADIEIGMQNRQLVRNAHLDQIGPACYELRMGNVYYDLTESDRPIDASRHGTVLIKPGHLVVLITLEEVVVPENMIARVTSKGSLFSVGLSAVSTYADPGFQGNMGIVTQNISDKFIELPLGESIAKIDFSLLSGATTRPYRGQHGYQTEIWPIKHHLQKSFEQVKNDPRVQPELAEAYRILPSATVSVLREVRRNHRRIQYAILVALAMNTLLIAAWSSKWWDTGIGLALNLISSGVAVGIAFVVQRKEKIDGLD